MSQTKSVVQRNHGTQSIQFKDGNQFGIIDWIEERGGHAETDHINKAITIKVPGGAIRAHNMNYIVWSPDEGFKAFTPKRYAFLYTEV